MFCRLSMPPVLLSFCCHCGVQVERGRQDALAWAEAVGFTRNGCPLFPTAQQADTMQRTLFAPSWLCAESFWHLQPDRCQSETSHTVSGLLPK